MSNETKVWSSLVDPLRMKHYVIGLSFPTLYNYPDVYELGMKIRKSKDKAEINELGLQYNEYLYKLKDIKADNNTGKALSELPNSLWLEQKPLPGKRAYMFVIRGNIIILTQACADILKAFNLGSSTLTPLKLYDIKTKQLISDDNFYFINVAEQRYFVKKEQANKDLEFEENGDTWRYIPNQCNIETYQTEKKDYTIDIDISATECDVDLWYDPHLTDKPSYFMSDRLRNALVEAKLDKSWCIHPCKMV